MTPIIWHCNACPAQILPCVYKNEMNRNFVPKMCPGDGGIADWKKLDLPGEP